VIVKERRTKDIEMHDMHSNLHDSRASSPDNSTLPVASDELHADITENLPLLS